MLIGDRVVAPDTAGALPGAVGIAAIPVRIPDDLDPAAGLTIAVRAGGVASNSVPLAVK